MRLGIVSDTHDDLDVVERAVTVFEDAGVDAVVHCGDVVAPFTAAAFDVGIEFHAVRGNNDGEWALADAVSEFGTYHGELAELAFDDREFAVYHGTSGAIVDALVDCGRYDYVLHGHTHEYAHEVRGGDAREARGSDAPGDRGGDALGDRDGTTRINPGGIAFEAAPDPPNVVVLDVGSGDTQRYELG